MWLYSILIFSCILLERSILGLRIRVNESDKLALGRIGSLLTRWIQSLLMSGYVP
jgi:hypothetical protein